MYILWYNIQTIKLHLPFIFQHCIAVIVRETLRPACTPRNCIHVIFWEEEVRNSSIISQAVKCMSPQETNWSRFSFTLTEVTRWELLLFSKQLPVQWVNLSNGGTTYSEKNKKNETCLFWGSKLRESDSYFKTNNCFKYSFQTFNLFCWNKYSVVTWIKVRSIREMICFHNTFQHRNAQTFGNL